MQFIGSFIVNNNLLLYDPAVNDIVAERFELSEENMNRLEVNSVSGTWNAYHSFNDRTSQTALFLVNSNDSSFNEEYDYDNILPQKLNFLGSIVSAFGHMVVAVDKHFAENKKYTYISNTEDMTYRIRDIKYWLLKYHADNKELLHEVIKKERQGEKYIDSDILFEYYGDCHIPCRSDLWAADCRYRLKNNPLEASVIQGGVVSMSYAYINNCYVDNIQLCNQIYISLDTNRIHKPTNITVVK